MNNKYMTVKFAENNKSQKDLFLSLNQIMNKLVECSAVQNVYIKAVFPDSTDSKDKNIFVVSFDELTMDVEKLIAEDPSISRAYVSSSRQLVEIK